MKNLTNHHSNPVVTLLKALINSRGELLRQQRGNTSDPVIIKHDKLKKAFDYALSIQTTDKGWSVFLATHEADLKHIMLGYGSKQRKSLEDKYNKAYFYLITKRNG